VKQRNGQTVQIKLADNFGVMGVAKASVADIGDGKYIGTNHGRRAPGRAVARRSTSFPRLCAAPAKATTTGLRRTAK